MRLVHRAVVRRVQVVPARPRHPDPRPGVGGVRADVARTARLRDRGQVAAHVAAGQPDRPQAGHHQLGEVLADPGPDPQHVTHPRGHRGGPRVVGEVGVDPVVEFLHRLPQRPCGPERRGGVRGHLGQHVDARGGQGEVDRLPPVRRVTAQVRLALLPGSGEQIGIETLRAYLDVGGSDDCQVGVRSADVVPGTQVAVHVDVRRPVGRRWSDLDTVTEKVLAVDLARGQVIEPVAGGDRSLVVVGRLVTDAVGGPHIPLPAGPGGRSEATHSGRGCGSRVR